MVDKKVFYQLLFEWWRKEGRVLPWREKLVVSHQSSDVSVVRENAISVREITFASYFSSESVRDPYRVVVSEIMLQQTQVDRVKQKYEAWMKKWPRIENLAKATLAEVIIEWKGLGYNRRARFLWLLANEIVNRRKLLSAADTTHNSVNAGWPTSEKELLQLPGIGRYTARAVLSFSFGKQVGVVDTNVKRIFQRVFQQRFEQPTGDNQYFEFADEILPTDLADPWNQALMDFGAVICTAKNPNCESCPIMHECEANIVAKNEGFENYAAKLLSIKKTNPEGINGPKKKQIKFELTDRFLRGRVIDLLREKELKEKEIIGLLSTKFTQFNSDRISLNVNKLIKEGLIIKENEMICLNK